MNDFDRRQDSPHTGPDADHISPGATAGEPPVRTVGFGGPVVACGCFALSALSFLTGGGILLVLVLFFLIPDWRANERYVPTSCVVLDKKLDTETFPTAAPRGGNGPPKESYRPQVKVRYEVDGRKFEVWAYNATRVYSEDKAAQQAVIDSFQVGSTRPCWYDPDSPDQAVLVRGHVWGAYAFLILPLGLMAVGAAGAFVAWMISSARPSPTAADGSPPGAPQSPRWAVMVQLPETPREAFDPSTLGDPVALKTEWTPLKTVSTNVRTRQLVKAGPDRLEFRASRVVTLLALFLLFSGFMPLVLVTGFSANGGRFTSTTLLLLLACLIYPAVGALVFYLCRVPIVFDKGRGYFWKGRKAPDEVYEPESLKSAARLTDVHALQLVSYYGHGERGGRYRLYQLNLVLNDGRRVPVVCHVSHPGIRDEASTVSQFLGKPVWDAT